MQAAKAAPPEQKNAWKEQFRNLDKTLKKNQDPSVAVEGIQEMLDTGALYMADDGNVYSSVPGRGGKKRNDRLLNAAGNWGDWNRDRTVDNGLASQEMNNILGMGRAEQEQQAWEYDASSGGYAPVMNEAPTLGARPLGRGIRDQISAAKHLGWRESEGEG